MPYVVVVVAVVGAVGESHDAGRELGATPLQVRLRGVHGFAAEGVLAEGQHTGTPSSLASVRIRFDIPSLCLRLNPFMRHDTSMFAVRIMPRPNLVRGVGIPVATRRDQGNLIGLRLRRIVCGVGGETSYLNM